MGLAKEESGHFLYRLFCAKETFSKFVFYLNVQCIENTFRIYTLLHIKTHYFIHFCYLFLKSLKAFSVSLINGGNTTQYFHLDTAQKINFSIKDSFSKCETADLVRFTDEILNGKLPFLCSVKEGLAKVTISWSISLPLL